MRLELTVAPTVEPVTVDEVKLHARVDIDDDDTLIENYIKSARLYVEHYIHSALLTQTWKITFDGCDIAFNKRVIPLPLKPILSITSYTSYDSENTATVFSSSNYRLSGNRVALNDSSDWPSNFRILDAIEIIFVAGYGATATSVPEDIKQAIRLLTAHYYDTREGVYDPMSGVKSDFFKVPFGITALLQPYKSFFLG